MLTEEEKQQARAWRRKKVEDYLADPEKYKGEKWLIRAVINRVKGIGKEDEISKKF